MALEHGVGLQSWELAVAKKLVGEYRRRSRRLAREEFEDLLQDCLAHWIEVRHRLCTDPDAPPVAYMAQAIRNKLTDRLREQAAGKRAGEFDTVSLDAVVDDAEDGPTLADLIEATESARPGDETAFDRRHARMELARAMERLTPVQRRLCLMLGDEALSIKEAAERLRIPRGTLYEQIKRIRKVFADQGLGDYLKD